MAAHVETVRMEVLDEVLLGDTAGVVHTVYGVEDFEKELGGIGEVRNVKPVASLGGKEAEGDPKVGRGI